MARPIDPARQRKLLGDYLIALGAISPEQLEAALKVQEAQREQRKTELIGQLLVRLEAATPTQVEEALRRQQAEDADR